MLAAAVAARTLSVGQVQAVQARITRTVVLAVNQAIRTVPSTPRQRVRVAQALYPVVSRARVQSYSLAVRHMQSVASRVGEELPDIPQPEPYAPEAIERVLEVAAEPRPAKSGGARRPDVAVVARDSSLSLDKHARQPGRDVVQRTADGGGEKVGWARVLTGLESCYFCAMLASRGPVFSGKSRALFIGGVAGNPFHIGCDCAAVLVLRGQPWEGEEEYDHLDRLWSDTTGKYSGRGKMNAFRRAFERPELHLPEDHPWRALDHEE